MLLFVHVNNPLEEDLGGGWVTDTLQPTGSLRWLHKESEGGGESKFGLKAQQRASRNGGRGGRGEEDKPVIGELILPRQ